MSRFWQFICYLFKWMFRDPPVECYESHNVRQFQQKFHQITNVVPTHLTKRKLYERLECLQEEVNEFKAAIETQDLTEQADALVDLVYFAKGTANMLGLPWAQLWDDVHTANMAKKRGVVKRGHQVDCIKPVGWTPPQTLLILNISGYQRHKFCRPSLGVDGKVTWVIDEERCCDDNRHHL